MECTLQPLLFSLGKHIVEQCIKTQVGRINIGELEGVREDSDGEAKNWHGNLNLHEWAFDHFRKILTYKPKVEDIEVNEVDERDATQTCCVCGKTDTDENQRVERGLYVCDEHNDAFNADVNVAENIRLDINNDDESNSESSGQLSGDRCTGWLAQPGVYLYDLSCGFQPQTEAVDCRS